jgi:hypothetical protein
MDGSGPLKKLFGRETRNEVKRISEEFPTRRQEVRVRK